MKGRSRCSIFCWVLTDVSCELWNYWLLVAKREASGTFGGQELPFIAGTRKIMEICRNSCVGNPGGRFECLRTIGNLGTRTNRVWPDIAHRRMRYRGTPLHWHESLTKTWAGPKVLCTGTLCSTAANSHELCTPWGAISCMRQPLCLISIVFFFCTRWPVRITLIDFARKGGVPSQMVVRERGWVCHQGHHLTGFLHRFWRLAHETYKTKSSFLTGLLFCDFVFPLTCLLWWANRIRCEGGLSMMTMCLLWIRCGREEHLFCAEDSKRKRKRKQNSLWKEAGLNHHTQTGPQIETGQCMKANTMDTVLMRCAFLPRSADEVSHQTVLHTGGQQSSYNPDPNLFCLPLVTVLGNLVLFSHHSFIRSKN